MLVILGLGGISACFFGCRHSRCTHIDLLWGAAHCDRTNMSLEEQKIDTHDGTDFLDISKGQQA